MKRIVIPGFWGFLRVSGVQVLDGDNVFLAFQDQELQRRQSAEASKNYFMPASLDFGVKALREWYLRMAEPLPWGAGARSPTAAVGQSRRQMLDRYEQHTKDCPSCAAVRLTAAFGFQSWNCRARVGVAFPNLDYWSSEAHDSDRIIAEAACLLEWLELDFLQILVQLLLFSHIVTF